MSNRLAPYKSQGCCGKIFTPTPSGEDRRAPRRVRIIFQGSRQLVAKYLPLLRAARTGLPRFARNDDFCVKMSVNIYALQTKIFALAIWFLPPFRAQNKV